MKEVLDFASYAEHALETIFEVVAVCDFTTHKVNVVAKSLDSSKTYFDGEVDMADTDATGMSGLYFKYGKKAYGSISFDNIEIFSADQYTE